MAHLLCRIIKRHCQFSSCFIPFKWKSSHNWDVSRKVTVLSYEIPMGCVVWTSQCSSDIELWSRYNRRDRLLDELAGSLTAPSLTAQHERFTSWYCMPSGFDTASELQIQTAHESECHPTSLPFLREGQQTQGHTTSFTFRQQSSLFGLSFPIKGVSDYWIVLLVSERSPQRDSQVQTMWSANGYIHCGLFLWRFHVAKNVAFIQSINTLSPKRLSFRVISKTKPSSFLYHADIEPI